MAHIMFKRLEQIFMFKCGVPLTLFFKYEAKPVFFIVNNGAVSCSAL